MSQGRVWFITGASRGLGVDIVKAALHAGHSVVATGRKADEVSKAIGDHKNLLVLKLDVTLQKDSDNAVKAAIDKFGRIDVLVNNAGNFFAGFFEDLSAEDIQKQIDTNLIGPLNVTRSVLPVLRKQKAGLIMTISSMAGLNGIEFGSAYALSKFAVEGWMLSLAPEVAPFGIHTTIVNPGFFRTDLLSQKSMIFGSNPQEDYREKRTQLESGWSSMAGQQPGDPRKLGDALVAIAGFKIPPIRFVAGADAVEGAQKVAHELLQQSRVNSELSTKLSY